MHKIILPAIAVLLLFSAGRAAGEEFSMLCAWERGGIFALKISDGGVIKNGHPASGQVSIGEDLVSWHETPIAGADYEYKVDRHSGILVASRLSNMDNRRVENKALCVKEGGGTEPGF